MTAITTWQLPQRLTALSASPWPQAVSEWRLRDIALLDPRDESPACLCGHSRLKELCFIQNIATGQRAIIGDRCIKLLSEEIEDDSLFSTIPRIFQACQRILKDPSHSANLDLINLAQDRGIFNEEETSFYSDIWRKRDLTSDQKEKKLILNKKLIHLMILTSPRAAFNRLVSYPGESTGPSIFNFAHDHHFITEPEWMFYSGIWYRANLSAPEINERNRINQKIIVALANHYFG